MRWRSGFWWALAGSFGLAILLVVLCQAGAAWGPSAGMSAPPAPLSGIEAAPSAHLAQTQFDGIGVPVRGFGVSFAVLGGSCLECAASAPSFPPHYGPLFRRPPPSLS